MTVDISDYIRVIDHAVQQMAMVTMTPLDAHPWSVRAHGAEPVLRAKICELEFELSHVKVDLRQERALSRDAEHWEREYDDVCSKLDRVRGYVEDPGNWSVFDSRREALLRMLRTAA